MTCVCFIDSRYACTDRPCPNSSTDCDSDSDIEIPGPVFPSTLPRFESDLECFEEVFPSLINALNNAGDAFAIGWLAGCVHDVMLCL